MREYLPLLIVGAVIGVFSAAFIAAYMIARKKLKDPDNERSISDREIIRRLLSYAKPYRKSFAVAFLTMAFSIVYDIMSPLLIGHIEETVTKDFELSYLLSVVALYAGILIVSLACTYAQSMILQKAGQKILTAIRQDTFRHIEELSHEQLNEIPVGKLVTRVSNDPNSILYMFTNIMVTLLKNALVIIGVLVAMFALNVELTLMVLCFVPFIVFFTVIFRWFSRRVHRGVTNATTDMNTFLSENLSGMKVTQIFNREDRKMKDFLQRSVKLKRAKYSRLLVFGVFRPMVNMLYCSSTLVLF